MLCSLIVKGMVGLYPAVPFIDNEIVVRIIVNVHGI